MLNVSRKINIHKAFLGILLLTLVIISTFEITYSLYLVTFLLYFSKVSIKTVDVISYLILILFIAIISSFFNKVAFYDWIKDLAYFTKPILGILSGYFIAKRIKSFKSILEVIILIATFFAIYHITIIFINVDFSIATTSDIRKIGGISNDIEAFAIMVLFCSFKIKELDINLKPLYKKIVLIVLVISFLLYLSRTMMVSLIILTLSAYGYLKITKKGLKYGLIVLLFFGLLYTYLFSANIRRGQSGFESFLYKMKNAPAEVFLPTKNFDTKNHAMLWDRWRAYEASMAITQINSYGNFFFGKGLGALVDLKFSAPLGADNIRYIPILHNGYVNIFFKSGILGLLLYLIMLLLLYLFSYIKTNNSQVKVISNLIGGFAVHYFFTTLIITGMYNHKEFYVIILGTLLYFRLEKNK